MNRITSNCTSKLLLPDTSQVKPLFFFLFLIAFFGANNSAAQTTVRHQSPQFVERHIPSSLRFEIPSISDQEILEALLFTRNGGQSGFRQQETRVENRTAQFDILVESDDINSVEYYFMVRTVSGQQITFPDINAGEPPLQLEVIDQREGSYIQADFIDVSILSPEENKVVAGENFIFAAALFYDDEDVDGGVFSLYLNGVDISEQAKITPFMVKFIPDSLTPGEQHFRIVFEKDKKKYSVAEYRFRTAGNLNLGRTDLVPETGVKSTRRPPAGTLELSSRNQKIAGRTNDAFDGRVRFSGKEGLLSYSVSGFLTSRESSRLQPQNRFSGELRYGKWALLEAGDVFPYFSNLSISGRRVRGLLTEVNVLNENLGLQFIYGDMKRSISNRYSPIERTERTIGGQVADTLFSVGFANGGRGSFEQNVFGARLSVGKEETVQFSIHGLKVEDDISSVNVIRDFRDVMEFDANLAENLSEDEIASLEENPEQLQVSRTNPKPRGNFVAGTELAMSFDSRRIRFRTEMAASLLNNDINGGPLDQQRADELGVELDESTESLFRRLSRFIVINDNMETLPFKFSENENGTLEVDAFFPASLLANQSRLDLDYFNHNFRLQYRWIGPDYQSLANSTIRRDVAGFTVSDRFRLIQNQLFVTLGYENLRDNLADNRDATLRTKTTRTVFSWFPVNQKLPGITLSMRYRTRDNRVERFNPFLDSQFLNTALRNFEVAEGDTILAANPRNNRTLALNGSVSQNFNLFESAHRASFTYSYLDTKDNVFLFGDSESNSFSFLLASRFDGRPFQTRIGWNASFTESTGGLTDINIYAIDLGADLFLLENRLSFNSDVSFARNTFTSTRLTVDDNNNPVSFFDNRFVAAADEEADRRSTNAYIFRMGATYTISASHSLIASANYSSIKNRLTSAENFPDDRILQLRYIFRF
ncbi:MAG TPA: hypothetical protein VKM36_03455 [Balneolaceae bacterium]|nr:hypothetical protein [Balneolaceae bacterium]